MFSVVVKQTSTKLGAETISIHYATRLLREGIQQPEASRLAQGLSGSSVKVSVGLWVGQLPTPHRVKGCKFHIQDDALSWEKEQEDREPPSPSSDLRGLKRQPHTKGKNIDGEMINKTKHSHRGQWDPNREI